MRRATTGALALSTFFLAGVAFAQPEGREQRFEQRDANRDGYLTQSEYGGHPGNFRALDRDGDNRLSRDEFVRRGGGGGGPVVALPDEFAYLDMNSDSTLSRAEWYGRDIPFDRVDRNNDGRISRDEFRDQGTAVAGQASQDRFYGLDTNSDGVLSRREWRGETVVFGTADTNDDGVVSLREYVAMPGSSDDRSVRFDELDRNEDGYVVWSEWRNSGINIAFNVVDTNGDGRITLREFQNSTADNPAQQFRSLDSNRDGFVSTWEWKGTRTSFNRRDADRDGRISRNEFNRYPYVSSR
jgi:Ca2+-binding EF-hand superfamily protein